MRLTAALGGSLKEMMAAEMKAAERAVTSGVQAATNGLKSDLRSQIVAAGLGPRLARTWRGEVYPKGQMSIGAAGLVWSKAPGIVRIYEDGATIRSTRGLYLAIPTPAAGKYGDGGAKITPGGWERRTGQRLRFIYRRGAASLLVADNMRARSGKRGGFAKASAAALRSGRGLASVPIFFLVPQVSFQKRLDVSGASTKWIRALPAMVVGNWQKGRDA
ncbi:MAG: DUF6441 family protein [Alphaproteobacteria bacterium]